MGDDANDARQAEERREQRRLDRATLGISGFGPPATVHARKGGHCTQCSRLECYSANMCFMDPDHGPPPPIVEPLCARCPEDQPEPFALTSFERVRVGAAIREHCERLMRWRNANPGDPTNGPLIQAERDSLTTCVNLIESIIAEEVDNEPC